MLRALLVASVAVAAVVLLVLLAGCACHGSQVTVQVGNDSAGGDLEEVRPIRPRFPHFSGRP